MPRTKPSIATLLKELARTTSESLSLDAIVAHVQTHRGPSRTNLYRRVQTMLTEQSVQLGWVSIAPLAYVPLRHAMRGISFRIIPDAAAISNDYLRSEWLYPFVDVSAPIRLGSDKRILPSYGPGLFGMLGWYAQHRVRPGDHIIVQLDHHRPNTIHLLCDHVDTQHLADAHLVDGLIMQELQHQYRNGADEHAVVHAIVQLYVNASWRNAYPGQPWQHLRDAVQRQHARGETLAHGIGREIVQLQNELRLRRTRDSERGLWNGIALRYSAVRIGFDSQEHELHDQLSITPIDTREDYTERINHGLEHGLYDVRVGEDESDTFADDDADEPFLFDDRSPALDDEEDYTDALRSSYDEDEHHEDDYAGNDYDDLSDAIDDDTFVLLFANRHPALVEWSTMLLKSMLPHERRQMIRAETDEDYNAILSKALQRLLPNEPQFMSTLRAIGDLAHPDQTYGGRTYAAFDSAERTASQSIRPSTEPTHEDDDVFATGGEAIFAVESALRESEQLIQRYVKTLQQSKLSDRTIRRKRQFLRGFAQFLARYYTQSLDYARYATLDEYIYFYYPRHTAAVSPRNIRDMITALRDFYRYSELPVANAAQAMYDCRHQAEAVMRLLLRTHQYPHEMTKMVVHLFAPYTA
ncbi:MAG: hypothetical protein FJ040_07650 [Chloroflexi bacterium]|nr:hypothetical protein [Chloroflexota bacterium]